MADRRNDENESVAPRRSLGDSAGGATSTGTSSRGGSSGGKSQRRGPKGQRPEGRDSARRTSGSSGPATQKMERVTGRDQERGRRDSASSDKPGARPRTRRARLRLVHVDPWSVFKTALLLSIAFGIVTVVAVGVVWGVLDAAGVWDAINRMVAEVVGGESGSAFNVENYVGTSRVLGFTMLVAVVDVVLITAVATLAAFLYNLAAALLGGIEVTLAEDER